MVKKSRKRKNKKYVYLMSAAAVLAAAAMVLFITTQVRGRSAGDDKEETTEKPDAAYMVGYDRYIVSEGITDYPILPTDIENIFVRHSPDGVFKYYEYTDENALSPLGDVKTVKVTVTCSSQKIPATIYYVDTGDSVTGYGLFTTAISDADVKLYEYAFFKICDMPEGYGDESVMLLVDFDKDDFLRAEKTYSEIFGLDLNSGKTTKLTGDNGRTVDKNGRMRTDWAVMTDTLLKTCGGERLYLSGRSYLLGTMNEKSDVLLINDASKKPSWKVSGIYGTYLKVTNDGLVYLRQTENGFDSVLNKDGDETVIAGFTERLDRYLISGDWLLNKFSLELTNILTGYRVTIGSEIKYPTSFNVNPEGTKAVIFRATPSNQTAVLCSLETGAFTASAGDNIVVPGIENAMWVGEGKFITVFKNNNDEYCYRLCSF